MTGTQKKVLFWVGTGLAAVFVYSYFKKQVTSGVSQAASAVGSTVASPFESLYTSITGMSPTPTTPVNQTPANALCYYTNAQGGVMYDSNGNIMSGPCAPGDIGTTPYPGS